MDTERRLELMLKLLVAEAQPVRVREHPQQSGVKAPAAPRGHRAAKDT